MQEIIPYNLAQRLSTACQSNGLFMTTKDKEGKVNTMSLGWTALGDAWNKPLFMAMVRLSRYTHKLVEETGVFTISIPRPGEMIPELRRCGEISGREADKIAAVGLSVQAGQSVDCPIISNCDLHVECRLVYTQEMSTQRMLPELAYSYAAGDLHTLFFAEIVAAYQL